MTSDENDIFVDHANHSIGGFGGHPGRFLEPPNPIFPRFSAHTGLLVARTADMQKPKENLNFS